MTEPTKAPRTPDYDRIWSDVYGDMQEVGPVHRHMKRLLRNLLAGLDYASVVDVGCGAGHNLDLLADGHELDRVAGLDISPLAVRRAAARGAGEFRVADIERERLDERFDLVFSALLLEHVRDDEAALANMRAMCDRHLVVTTMAGEYERYLPWEEQVGHVRNYRRGELEQKLRRAGFTPRRAIYWGFPLYSPLVRRLLNRTRATSEVSATARAAAHALYAAYFLNSSRRGDLLLVHATAS